MEYGLQFSTTFNETQNTLHDPVVTQYTLWTEDPRFNKRTCGTTNNASLKEDYWD